MTHPAITTGNVAVITGGADGIGLAAANYYLSRDMRVCIADIDQEKLDAAVQNIGEVLALRCDVSNIREVSRLKDQVIEHYGRVDVLMNNAGIGIPAGSWDNYENWQTLLDVNLWGVINGMHCFVPAMIAQGTPGLVINTGSKQGITTPPGNPAYNVSKAGVKAATEALQHELRNTEGCKISAHLLVPGFVYTGMVRQFLPEKPESAWLPEQVVEFLVDALDRGDFYVICPDNDVSRAEDNKRMAWAMGDIIENRPPLSRWHPDFQGAFESYMKE